MRDHAAALGLQLSRDLVNRWTGSWGDGMLVCDALHLEASCPEAPRQERQLWHPTLCMSRTVINHHSHAHSHTRGLQPEVLFYLL